MNGIKDVLSVVEKRIAVLDARIKKVRACEALDREHIDGQRHELKIVQDLLLIADGRVGTGYAEKYVGY